MNFTHARTHTQNNQQNLFIYYSQPYYGLQFMIKNISHLKEISKTMDLCT